ncbi:MAG: hypothetical protein M3T55_07210 [Pseudomonadota bacterium]|nr:hypothetical protein [Pseudomonadota bacterium]
MTKLIRTFTIGSCGLHIPQAVLTPRRFINYPFGRLGFRQTPFALSSGAAVQLYDFCVGKRLLPEAVRLLAYMDKNQPIPETRYLVEDAEIVLLELSTPIEPMIGDAIVNFNRVAEYIRDPLRNWGVDPKIINNWSNALFQLRGDFRERRDILLENWPKGAPDDTLARFGVENLWCRRLGVEEMVRDLEQLRDRVDAPILLKLFDFQYMPDGRAIEWPAGFKKQQIEVAEQMSLPTLDMAPIVARLGGKRLIAEDMMHWRADSSALQAQLMYDALADVLGRPRLESYPEASGLRREIEMAYPELAQLGEPISLTGVIQIPPRPVSSTRRDKSAPTRSLPTDELADRLNWALIDLHRRRLNDLGVTESGLGPHYQGVVEKETLVGLREERVLDLLSRRLPPYDAYAIMRAGLGELALLIAASGRRVIAYEPYPTRRSAIEAGRTHLEGVGLLAPGALTVVAALTPVGPLDEHVLGIGLDVVHFANEATAAPHLERVTAFEAMLIDPRIFLRLRRDPEEQTALARNLHDAGFDERKDFPGDYLCWFYRSGRDLSKLLDLTTRLSL